MKTWNSEKNQNKILRRLEKQERQDAFKRDRFFKFKLTEIHNKLSQNLLMENIIETDKPGAVSNAILKGLKKALNSSEFDLNYFVAPIRELIPHPNIHALYMTQYILEVLIEDPDVIDIFGTDEHIYKAIKGVFDQVSAQFEKTEEAVRAQIASDKSIVPGSSEYEIAFEQLLFQKVGEPQK